MDETVWLLVHQFVKHLNGRAAIHIWSSDLISYWHFNFARILSLWLLGLLFSNVIQTSHGFRFLRIQRIAQQLCITYWLFVSGSVSDPWAWSCLWLIEVEILSMAIWLIIFLGLKYLWPLYCYIPWACLIIGVWLVCQYSFITIYIQLGFKRRIILRGLKYLRLSGCYLRGTCLIDRSLPGNCCLSSATKGSRQKHFLLTKSCLRGSNS